MVDKANLMDIMEMYLTDWRVRKLALRMIDGYCSVRRDHGDRSPDRTRRITGY